MVFEVVPSKAQMEVGHAVGLILYLPSPGQAPASNIPTLISYNFDQMHPAGYIYVSIVLYAQ
jgi:hypothetical protein